MNRNRLWLIVLSVLSVPMTGQAKPEKNEYWTDEIKAVCSNVPPLDRTAPNIMNNEDVRKQDEQVNRYFTQLVEQFKIGNIEHTLEGSQNFLKNWPGSAQQRQCIQQISIISEAITAKQVEQEERAKREQTTPAGRLKTLYLRYMAIQACYENRKEFRVPYVTAQELAAAKEIARREETNLVKKDSALAAQKDKVWGEAKNEYSKSALAFGLGLSGTKYNSEMAGVCRSTAASFTSDTDYQKGQIKKDF